MPRLAGARARPARLTTGPRTPEGKAKAARNGAGKRRPGLSEREARQLLNEVGNMVSSMAGLRGMLLGGQLR